jgi:hypothetical protein
MDHRDYDENKQQDQHEPNAWAESDLQIAETPLTRLNERPVEGVQRFHQVRTFGPRGRFIGAQPTRSPPPGRSCPQPLKGARARPPHYQARADREIEAPFESRWLLNGPGMSLDSRSVSLASGKHWQRQLTHSAAAGGRWRSRLSGRKKDRAGSKPRPRGQIL